MNQEGILSGAAGLMAIQQVLNGPSSRRRLRSEVQRMLRPGYRAGRLHLTRAKFKPGRKLSAYYTFPANDPEGQTSHWVQLAVTWRKNIDGDQHTDSWRQLQEEANQAGLMPVQCELWRELPERDMKLQIWPFDPEFPHLIQLGDPSYVAEMFASLGLAHDSNQIPVITPIRYRPGERHVLRYDLDSREPGRQRLYAKLYTNAQDAVKAFGVANRVVDWLDDNDVGLRGNRPVAMSPEEYVIFYPHASGIPLSHQFHRSHHWLATQLQLIGKSLAILHQGPESLQADLRQNTFAKEVKVVKRASEHIQALLPQAHAKLVQIVDQAEDQYSALPQEKPTFTHSDFKSDHLLTTAEGLTLIDFDTCTLTDPAMDIGKFLADLEWWFTLRRISGVEEAQSELLKGYLAGAGSNDGVVHERLARARFFYALIFVKIIVRRVPLYKNEWATRTGKRIERAAEVLREAVKV